MRHDEIPLPPELVAFVRKEQMQRLKRLFGGKQSAPAATTKVPA